MEDLADLINQGGRYCRKHEEGQHIQSRKRDVDPISLVNKESLTLI